MQGLRISFCRHRMLAMALFALAIGMKALVPSGYMPGSESKTLTFQICDGKGGELNGTVSVPAPDDQAPGKRGQAGHDGLCPHSAVSHVAMIWADPVQLALALLFLFAMGFAALLMVVRAHALHLRLPLPGPPAHP